VTIVLLSGCEQSLNVLEAVSEIKGYNTECFTAIMEELQALAPSDYDDYLDVNSFKIIEEGLSMYTSNYQSSPVLSRISIDNWVASDKTELNGIITMHIYYDSVTENITYITTTTELFYDSVYATFETTVYNGALEDDQFSIGFDTYDMTSLNIDGKSYIFDTDDD
jgi:hypothetical protein